MYRGDIKMIGRMAESLLREEEFFDNEYEVIGVKNGNQTSLITTYIPDEAYQVFCNNKNNVKYQEIILYKDEKCIERYTTSAYDKVEYEYEILFRVGGKSYYDYVEAISKRQAAAIIRERYKKFNLKIISIEEV